MLVPDLSGERRDAVSQPSRVGGSRGLRSREGGAGDSHSEGFSWYMEGKIDIDSLITHKLPLARINEAFDLMHEGKSIRSVVVF